jgi:hypothetical protein
MQLIRQPSEVIARSSKVITEPSPLSLVELSAHANEEDDHEIQDIDVHYRVIPCSADLG